MIVSRNIEQRIGLASDGSGRKTDETLTMTSPVP